MRNTKYLKRTDYIKLNNHTSSPVSVSMRDKTMVVEPKNENDIPGFIDVLWEDVDWINSKTNCFRIGLLRFNKNEEKEIYEALGIFEWKDILIEEMMEDIMLHPTLEGLQKIVNISEVGTIERVRAVLTNFINNDIEISAKVVKIVGIRFKEISRGERVSKIILSPKESFTPVDGKEVTTMKNEIAELKTMVAELSKKR